MYNTSAHYCFKWHSSSGNDPKCSGITEHLTGITVDVSIMHILCS